MKKRGARPQGKVEIVWSADFAYAIGLLATDGCLSKNKRHISFVSKDIEQIGNFFKALKIKDIKIGRTSSKSSGKKVYYHRVQFGDVLFYRFLVSIGLTEAKSKTMGAIIMPDCYFFDYLRGCFDGDGCFYSYWDPRWRSSFMFYTEFSTASKKHACWLQGQIFSFLDVTGHISKAKNSSSYRLRFAKKDSMKILKKIYQNKNTLYLKRKKLKIDKSLAMIGESLDNC